MKIKSLEVRNIKRVREARLEFGDKPLFIIGGDNEEGKSSVLDAIPYAMAGKRAWPERPLRDGADRGEVVVDCGEMRTSRTFTQGGGGTLNVLDAEGKQYRSPQTVLDGLVNGFNFDPLAFLRAKPAAQAEQLRQMVGLDLSGEDAAIAERKERRRAADDRRREHQAELARVVVPEGDVGDPIDLTPLVQQIAAADGHNRKVEAAERVARNAAQDEAAERAEIVRIEVEMERLRGLLAEARVRLVGKTERAGKAVDAVMGMSRVSTDDLLAQHRAAQAHNAQVEARARARELAALIAQRVDRAAADVATMDEEIAEITRRRQQRLVDAQYPVAGLGLENNTVTYDAVPLEQASGAGQLRVAVAMGLALNPTLRTLIIRDGSLLDARSLKLVEAIAREHDAQILMERVGAGPECDVIMKDGTVLEVRDVR